MEKTMEGSMHVLGLMLCLLGFSAHGAQEFSTQIVDMDFGDGQRDEVLVFLGNGLVAKLNSSKNNFLSMGEESFHQNRWYSFKLDEKRFITEAQEIPAPFNSFYKSQFFSLPPETYVPTTVSSMKLAQTYHREARYYPKESQCFNRALVWSYEWWKKHSLKSNKLFIYFTRSYIRRYNFEWWFHIAPYVHVLENGKVVERVLDVKYTSGPRKFQDWANTFLKNDAPCTVITKYSDYADYPYTGDCYFQRTHMYTYQPADLQMYEAWGYSKDQFNMDEVRGAYLEAFNENI
jgi:hypothetical protein